MHLSTDGALILRGLLNHPIFPDIFLNILVAPLCLYLVFFFLSLIMLTYGFGYRLLLNGLWLYHTECCYEQGWNDVCSLRPRLENSQNWHSASVKQARKAEKRSMESDSACQGMVWVCSLKFKLNMLHFNI